MEESRPARIGDIEDIGIRMTERVITEVTAHLSAKIDQALAEVEARLRQQDAHIAQLGSTVRVAAAAAATKMLPGLADVSTGPPPSS
ncbi:hypothetical protein E1264_28565, partial [Actinomadura sp. KC216]|uniref:hypothetical protein n=1 Tax=Actinomadura sp. KC216 TaxID=2530370 RepID=UPI0010486D5B